MVVVAEKEELKGTTLSLDAYVPLIIVKEKRFSPVNN